MVSQQEIAGSAICKSSEAFRWWSFNPHLGRMNERNDKWPCGWPGRLRFSYLRASISYLIITSSEGGSLWLNLHSQSLSCLKSFIMNLTATISLRNHCCYGFCCSIQWKPPHIWSEYHIHICHIMSASAFGVFIFASEHSPLLPPRRSSLQWAESDHVDPRHCCVPTPNDDHMLIYDRKENRTSVLINLQYYLFKMISGMNMRLFACIGSVL